MSRKTTAYLLLLVVSIIWGAASPIVKHTLQWFDPWIFLTYRFFISSVVAIPFLLWGKLTWPKKSSDSALVLLVSIISAPLTLWLFFEALTKTTALSGSLFTAIGPLLVVLGGALFFRDKIRPHERAGIVITIIGALITVFGPLVGNGHASSLGGFEGNLLMVLAVMVDSSAALLTMYALKRNVNPMLLAHVSFIVGFLLFFPFLLSRLSISDIWSTIASAPIQAHMGVLFMALLSGTIAYTLRNLALKSVEVSESALYTYLQPLWGALLAVWWLKEEITPSYIIGGIVIAFGVLLAEQRKK